MIENLHILRNKEIQDGEGLVKAITDITHEVVYQSTSARQALQWAIHALAGGGGEISISRGQFVVNYYQTADVLSEGSATVIAPTLGTAKRRSNLLKQSAQPSKVFINRLRVLSSLI